MRLLYKDLQTKLRIKDNNRKISSNFAKNKRIIMDYTLPSDPSMLMSFINMKLRDEYSNLDMLCEDLDIDRQWLEDKLRQIGLEYSEEHNKFW